MIWLFLNLCVQVTLLTAMKGLWLSITALTVLILLEIYIPVTPNIHFLEANAFKLAVSEQQSPKQPSGPHVKLSSVKPFPLHLTAGNG